ncbi:hypothetical protein ACIQC5_13480 [Paenarthrobacter sp. NPDC092416]|uniref:hypothetical protein n=1 Tax=Paenarthrobacter sp. NPDC092416 TaxID=3364386 RepID=UPI0037F55B7C
MNKSRAHVMAAAVLLLISLPSCAPGSVKPLGSESSQAAPTSSNDAYANIPANQIQQAGMDVDFMWEPEDPFYGFNEYPVVARVYIESIDSGRSFSPISNQYVFPQTVGRMSIKEVYKGDLKPDVQVNYSRVGGTVTYDDYWNSLNQAQQEKILQLNRGQKPTDAKYIQAKITDDIDIEAGKEYVAFLQLETSKDGSLKEYSINGYQYGLREVRSTGAEATVLNNATQAWESLGSFVKLP